MKKRYSIAGAVLLVVLFCLLIRKNSHVRSVGGEVPASHEAGVSGVIGNGPAGLETKASLRDVDSAPTHRPEQLVDFMLADVVIEGLTLEKALRVLAGAYEEACRKSGEAPLGLRFSGGEESGVRISLNAGNRSFRSAVRLLASVAGMTVKRNGLEYWFERIPDERGPVTRTVPHSMALKSKLRAMLGVEMDAGDSPESWLKAVGMELDPTTSLQLRASGDAVIGTDSAADAKALAALFQTLLGDALPHHKISNRVIEIPAGVEWSGANGESLSPREVEAFVEGLAGIPGVDIMMSSAMSARNGEPEFILLLRELAAPLAGSEGEYESHIVGQVFEIKGRVLGFGNEVNLRYTDTSGDLDASGAAVITERTNIDERGFSGDGLTRMAVQRRPDGSATVVLTTATLIDGAGRPLR